MPFCFCPLSLIAYEFVSNTNLEQLLDDSEQILTRDLLFSVAVDVISAIEFLELRGIVHNNIQPSRVIIGQSSRVSVIS